MKKHGFPQHIGKGDVYAHGGQLWRSNEGILRPSSDFTKIPSFEQVIEVLGEEFSSVMRIQETSVVVAFVARNTRGTSAIGPTATEAAGRLYIATHK